MKHAGIEPRIKPRLVMKKLLPALVACQLVAAAGVALAKNSDRIPAAYRVSVSANDLTPSNNSPVAAAKRTGKLKLSWSAPSTRTDGEPLSLAEIGGYRIYYGQRQGEYVRGADVKDGAAQLATVTDVPAGEYYVVMTTYDVNGLEGGYSDPVIKTVKAKKSSNANSNKPQQIAKAGKPAKAGKRDRSGKSARQATPSPSTKNLLQLILGGYDD